MYRTTPVGAAIRTTNNNNRKQQQQQEAAVRAGGGEEQEDSSSSSPNKTSQSTTVIIAGGGGDGGAEKNTAFDDDNNISHAAAAKCVQSTAAYLATAESKQQAAFAKTLRNSNSIKLAPESMASMISFNSSSDDGLETLHACDVPSANVDVLYSLLSILSSQDRLQSSQMLLNMSQEKDNCPLLRGSGCLSLLVQLLHPVDAMPPPPDDFEIVRLASEALRNIVRFDDDEASRNRDCVILALSEHLRKYVLQLRAVVASAAPIPAADGKGCESAFEAMTTLVQLSYNEESRRSMCSLGALQCIAEALILDERVFRSNCHPMNRDFRRMIGMALTNLTFGASETKRLLCSNNNFLRAVNTQIQWQPEELKQIFASVVRNLSWKTNRESKDAMKEAGTVEVLMRAAMEVERETTLKSVLSALWNLSYHSSENKARICAVPSALEFLVKTLAYKSPSGSVAVVESCGGILRNISSHISLKEEYRAVLRQHNCFKTLLEHLESASLTIVSNACGTLWNLSAYNMEDQRTLRQMGAEKKLRDLVHSKHKIISCGSAATLKNLLTHRSRGDGAAAAATTTVGNPNNKAAVASNPRRIMTAMECSSSVHGSPHHSALVVGETTTTTTSTSVSFSPQQQRHRATAAAEIAALLNDVTRPVGMTTTMKASTPPFKIPAPPPMKFIGDGTATTTTACTQPLTVSTSCYSTPSSRDDQIHMDKAAVLRFHGTRPAAAAPPDLTASTRNDYGPSSFSTSTTMYANAAASISGQFPPIFSNCGESPLSNQTGKKQAGEKSSKAAYTTTDRGGGGGFQQKRSGTTTPAEFKSEASSLRGSKSATAAMTPLVFSRHSSVDSLDSCEQHSLRSTVYSEYSQLATGLPSPSELPDSPTGFPTTTNREKVIVATKIMDHQRQNVFNFDDKITGGGDPNATGTAAVAESGQFIDQRAQRLGSIKSADDDEEKPKVYGKDQVPNSTPAHHHYAGSPGAELWNEPTHRRRSGAADGAYEEESRKLSASSSLSALTVDSDAKPTSIDRVLNQNERLKTAIEQFGFFRAPDHLHRPSPPTSMQQRAADVAGRRQREDEDEDDVVAADLCPELQACILSARPVPNSGSKVHHGSVHQSSAKRTNRTTKQDSHAVAAFEAIKNTDGEDDLRLVMHSAMPKPKQGHHQKSSNSRLISPRKPTTTASNVGIARPILRSSSSSLSTAAAAAAIQGHVMTTTHLHDAGANIVRARVETDSAADPAAKQRYFEHEIPDTTTDDVMEKSEELMQCIAMAMPKPKLPRKSKSLDRRSQKHQLSFAARTNDCSGRRQGGMGNASSFTTSSGSLALENSSSTSGGGGKSSELFLSSSSAQLMNSAATAERIKDGTVLFDSTNPAGIPVARIAPEPHIIGDHQRRLHHYYSTIGSTADDHQQQPVQSEQPASAPPWSAAVVENPRGDWSATNVNSTVRNEDSLSEDNYSHLLDDSFSLKPEDVDIDSLKDDDWVLFGGANENLVERSAVAAEAATNDAGAGGESATRTSPSEVFIDCDAFSNGDTNDLLPTGQGGRPKIVKGPLSPPATTDAMKAVIRGGQRALHGYSHGHGLASTLAAPRMAVRTTKAAELRAKKLQQQEGAVKHSPTHPTTGTTGLRSPIPVARSRSMSPATNVAAGLAPSCPAARRNVLPTERTPTAQNSSKTSPSFVDHFLQRHHSGGGVGQLQASLLSATTALGRDSENEMMMTTKSPRRAHVPSTNTKCRITTSNLLAKIDAELSERAAASRAGKESKRNEPR